MRIDQDVKLNFKDVLIRPKRSTLHSRKDVRIERRFTFRWTDKTWEGVPIIAANMDTIGTLSMAKALGKFGMLTAIHKFTQEKEWEDETLPFSNMMITIGISDQTTIDLKSFFEKYPKLQWICLDVANGYTERFVDRVKEVRERFPDKIIVAGNVVTGEMTEQLILAGADVVKVGIGPGSVCTTSGITGVGYPQLSAVIESADAAHGIGGHIVSDGGCVFAGDVAKAFGGGADFVMLGGMLAGHQECEGEIVQQEGQSLMRFYGMSSDIAMAKYYGEIAHYRASEGKSILVPYKGPVDDTVRDLLGGLRSACTYAGARRLKDLPKSTTFVRVTSPIACNIAF